MDIFRVIFFLLIPTALLLLTLGSLHYAQQKNLFEESVRTPIAYDKYKMSKTSAWPSRFDFLEEDDYNAVKSEISQVKGNTLVIKEKEYNFVVQYEAQIDESLIERVSQVNQRGDRAQYGSHYYLIQYDKFVEIVHFQTGNSADQEHNSEVCLQLPIKASSNARYHVDSHSNLWIVTTSMNKVVFIQIYSCKESRLVRQYRHQLKDGEFVNSVRRVMARSHDCMEVQVVTYGLSRVDLRVCPYGKEKEIVEVGRDDAVQMEYEAVNVTEWQVFQGNSDQKSKDQLFNIIQYSVNLFTFEPTAHLLYEPRPPPSQNKIQDFDAIVVDQQNHYLLTLSRNRSQTGIMTLNKYMIAAGTPLFHNNPSYQKYSALDILDREYRHEPNPFIEHKYIVPGLNHTKSMNYKAAYVAHPGQQIEHIGLSDRVVVFWPQEKLKEESYNMIRTKVGGLVSEGNKLKGTYDKFPVQYEQVFQRADAKPQQVMPGLFEAHAGYINLMTYLHKAKGSNAFTRIQLINGIAGKSILTHYLSTKSGYEYTSTMLLNNQWWVLEYNPILRQSMATKYQLYVNSSNPQALLNTKRIYGMLNTQEEADGEDDLASLMRQFTQKHNNGFILLNVFRCVDEYYYFEYSDASGKSYGIARIHFKNLSNRRVKQSQNYASVFERMLLVGENMMYPDRSSRQAYAVTLSNIDLFKHVPSGNYEQSNQRSWHRYCDRATGDNMRLLQRQGKFYYFPVQYYAVGNYGCRFNSGEPHSESILSFNMRNIITLGKRATEQHYQLRRGLVFKIVSCLLIYTLFMIVVHFMTKKTCPPHGQPKKDEKKSQKQSEKKTEEKTEAEPKDKKKDKKEKKGKKGKTD